MTVVNARPVLFAIVIALVAAPARAQMTVDPMAATVATWLTMIEKSFVGLAEAMPAEQYGFKPSRSPTPAAC